MSFFSRGQRWAYFIVAMVVVVAFYAVWNERGQLFSSRGSLARGRVKTKVLAHVIPVESWHTTTQVPVYWVHEGSNPMVDVRVTFDGGSLRDGGNEGLAVLTNHLMGAAAGDKSTAQVALSYENVGAQLSYEAGRSMAYVGLRTLSKEVYLRPAVHQLLDSLSHPRFKLKDVKREQAQMLTALKDERQSAARYAVDQMFGKVYAGTVYAHNPLGTVASIEKLTGQRAEAFYRKYYARGNAQIVIVGDVTQFKAEDLAERIGRALPSGVHAPLVLRAQLKAAGGPFHVKMPTSQTTVLLGAQAVAHNAPDLMALQLGSRILGGGMTSLLFQELREKQGLAYVASSSLMPAPYGGLFMLFSQTKTASAAKAQAMMAWIFQSFLANGPEEADLVLAKEQMAGGFFVRLASNSQILDKVSSMAFYHEPFDQLDRYQKMVEAISAADIKRAFARLMDGQVMRQLWVGPKAPPASLTVLAMPQKKAHVSHTKEHKVAKPLTVVANPAVLHKKESKVAKAPTVVAKPAVLHKKEAKAAKAPTVVAKPVVKRRGAEAQPLIAKRSRHEARTGKKAATSSKGTEKGVRPAVKQDARQGAMSQSAAAAHG